VAVFWLRWIGRAWRSRFGSGGLRQLSRIRRQGSARPPPSVVLLPKPRGACRGALTNAHDGCPAVVAVVVGLAQRLAVAQRLAIMAEAEVMASLHGLGSEVRGAARRLGARAFTSQRVGCGAARNFTAAWLHQFMVNACRRRLFIPLTSWEMASAMYFAPPSSFGNTNAGM
jgi:hypothetical protein